MAQLQSSARGLTTEEAAARLRRYGRNALPEPAPPSSIRLLAEQLTHTLALLLWAATALAFLAGLPQLGWAILAIIILNAGFSFWQEHRAGEVVQALRRRMPMAARVLRDGVEHRVAAADLVPGDVIVLRHGDRVSADARLLSASNLRLDYSILTGESAPVHRSPAGNGAENLADAGNCVLAGTTVMEGSAEALIFATGAGTAFGAVASLTQRLRLEASPLQKELGATARTVAMVAITVGLVCIGAGALSERLSQRDSFIFGLGILVALIPEGLLPTVSLSLAMGVQRMASRHAIVKRLSSVETLGCTSVICTDKTGTITTNEMTVREVWAGPHILHVTGGDSLHGSLKEHGIEVTDARPASLEMLLRCGTLCNNGIPPHPHRRRTGLGDPLDEALLVLAIKAGMDPDTEREAWPRLHEFPFDAVRRRMSTVNAEGERRYVLVKGGPGEVLAQCSREAEDGGAPLLTDVRRQEILAGTSAESARGMRPLALAYRELTASPLPGSPEEAEHDLVYLGVVMVNNPLRPEVPAAVARCRTAGIEVVMLTGDHADTAVSVARDAGIDEGDGRVVTGQEIDYMSDDELLAFLGREQPRVFARVTPPQKLRLVEAYQSLGRIVAVTGDGVNDAPALRAADIGVAMGRRGTDVAREAADMVLLDDNFATIVNAVEEGRAVFDNIRKFLTYFLTSNVAEAAPFVLFVLFGVPLPLTVLQVLLVDLGTDTLPGLALGVDPPAPGSMERKPRSIGEGIVSGGLLLRALGFLGMAAAVISLSGNFLFQWDVTGTFLGDFIGDGPVYEQATTVTMAGIVACQAANVFACRSDRRSVFAMGWRSSRLIVLAVLAEIALLAAVIGIPPLADMFSLQPIDPRYWPMLATFPFVFLAADEVRKFVVARLRRAR